MSHNNGFPIYKNTRALQHLFGKQKNVRFLQDFLETYNGLPKGKLKGLKILDSEILSEDRVTEGIARLKIKTKFPDGTITYIIF